MRYPIFKHRRAFTRRSSVGKTLRGTAWIFIVLFFCISASGGEICHPQFVPYPLFDIGNNMGTNALSDLNGDGHLDLTTGIIVFLGDGSGSFQESFEIKGHPPIVFDVLAGDFDQDGRIDLVLGLPVGQSVYVLFGREPGNSPETLFEEPISVSSVLSPWHVDSDDLNHDGLPDIVAVSAEEKELSILLNSGDRTFQSSKLPVYSTGHDIALGDFNGDAHLDIVFGDNNNSVLLFGKGDGTFNEEIVNKMRVDFVMMTVHRLCTSDLDRDGLSDIIAIGDKGVVVYRGCSIDIAEGLPVQPDIHLELVQQGRFVEISDMNGDGTLDLVTQIYSDTAVLQVFCGQQPSEGGDPSFVAGTPFIPQVSGRGSVLAIGDVNDDGATDIVLTSEETDNAEVFINDAACFHRTAEPGDVTFDGKIDIADPIALFFHLYRGGPLACPAAAEVTGDGLVDLEDPLYIIYYLFTGGPAPSDSSPRDCYVTGARAG